MFGIFNIFKPKTEKKMVKSNEELSIKHLFYDVSWRDIKEEKPQPGQYMLCAFDANSFVPGRRKHNFYFYGFAQACAATDDIGNEIVKIKTHTSEMRDVNIARCIRFWTPIDSPIDKIKKY